MPDEPSNSAVVVNNELSAKASEVPEETFYDDSRRVCVDPSVQDGSQTSTYTEVSEASQNLTPGSRELNSLWFALPMGLLGSGERGFDLEVLEELENWIQNLKEGRFVSPKYLDLSKTRHRFAIKGEELGIHYLNYWILESSFKPITTLEAAKIVYALFEKAQGHENWLKYLISILQIQNWRGLPYKRRTTNFALAGATLYSQLNTYLPMEIDLSFSCAFESEDFIERIRIGESKFYLEVWPGYGESYGGFEFRIGLEKGASLAHLGVLFEEDAATIITIQGGGGFLKNRKKLFKALNGQDPFIWLIKNLETWLRAQGYQTLRGYGYGHNPTLIDHFKDGTFDPADEAIRQRFYRIYDGRFEGEELGLEKVDTVVKEVKGVKIEANVFEKSLLPSSVEDSVESVNLSILRLMNQALGEESLAEAITVSESNSPPPSSPAPVQPPADPNSNDNDDDPKPKNMSWLDYPIQALNLGNVTEWEVRQKRIEFVGELMLVLRDDPSVFKTSVSKKINQKLSALGIKDLITDQSWQKPADKSVWFDLDIELFQLRYKLNAFLLRKLKELDITQIGQVVALVQNREQLVENNFSLGKNRYWIDLEYFIEQLFEVDSYHDVELEEWQPEGEKTLLPIQDNPSSPPFDLERVLLSIQPKEGRWGEDLLLQLKVNKVNASKDLIETLERMGQLIKGNEELRVYADDLYKVSIALSGYGRLAFTDQTQRLLDKVSPSLAQRQGIAEKDVLEIRWEASIIFEELPKALVAEGMMTEKLSEGMEGVKRERERVERENTIEERNKK